MSKEFTTAIVWFRRDLRLSDNPALTAAVKRSETILPVFIWSPNEHGSWAPGGASKWWLHHSLSGLGKAFAEKDCELLILEGPSEKTILELVKKTSADFVVWNRLYEPAAVKRDEKIKKSLKESGIGVESFNGSLLLEPWENMNQSGKPYKVFTPFWKSLVQELKPQKPLRAPGGITQSDKPNIKTRKLSDLSLLPKLDWDEGFYEYWTPGEEGGAKAVRRFKGDCAKEYSDTRNRPDLQGTSRLSPHLHFGEISPRQIWHKLFGEQKPKPSSKSGVETFLREIGWREFAHHLLFHFPETVSEPLRQEFEEFPWNKKKDFLRAWQKGQTGYPIVDAGMRELWHTGWMHNRVRMIVASFLVKHLLQPWQDGARWFWDTLVDADLANNSLGWQWTAGCGADAAPYFRVFNPILQGEKFDPNGDYVRKWCPELEKLDNSYLHKPWEAPKEALSDAGVELGKTYPEPLVDHQRARRTALEAYDEIKDKKAA